jgi:hypothetical protein
MFQMDGQLSVVQGDTLEMLDDTNAYWWLVRNVKTSEHGFVPAEFVEVPFFFPTYKWI